MYCWFLVVDQNETVVVVVLVDFYAHYHACIARMCHIVRQVWLLRFVHTVRVLIDLVHVEGGRTSERSGYTSTLEYHRWLMTKMLLKPSANRAF